MDFGKAIKLLKEGKKVARKGWNGKGMWLELNKGYDYKFSIVESHILMKTVQNYFIPWLASQTDVLAEDWEIIN